MSSKRLLVSLLAVLGLTMGAWSQLNAQTMTWDYCNAFNLISVSNAALDGSSPLAAGQASVIPGYYTYPSAPYDVASPTSSFDPNFAGPRDSVLYYRNPILPTNPTANGQNYSNPWPPPYWTPDQARFLVGRDQGYAFSDVLRPQPSAAIIRLDLRAHGGSDVQFWGTTLWILGSPDFDPNEDLMPIDPDRVASDVYNVSLRDSLSSNEEREAIDTLTGIQFYSESGNEPPGNTTPGPWYVNTFDEADVRSHVEALRSSSDDSLIYEDPTAPGTYLSIQHDFVWEQVPLDTVKAHHEGAPVVPANELTEIIATYSDSAANPNGYTTTGLSASGNGYPPNDWRCRTTLAVEDSAAAFPYGNYPRLADQTYLNWKWWRATLILRQPINISDAEGARTPGLPFKRIWVTVRSTGAHDEIPRTDRSTAFPQPPGHTALNARGFSVAAGDSFCNFLDGTNPPAGAGLAMGVDWPHNIEGLSSADTFFTCILATDDMEVLDYSAPPGAHFRRSLSTIRLLPFINPDVGLAPQDRPAGGQALFNVWNDPSWERERLDFFAQPWHYRWAVSGAIYGRDDYAPKIVAVDPGDSVKSNGPNRDALGNRMVAPDRVENATTHVPSTPRYTPSYDTLRPQIYTSDSFQVIRFTSYDQGTTVDSVAVVLTSQYNRIDSIFFWNDHLVSGDLSVAPVAACNGPAPLAANALGTYPYVYWSPSLTAEGVEDPYTGNGGRGRGWAWRIRGSNPNLPGAPVDPVYSPVDTNRLLATMVDEADVIDSPAILDAHGRDSIPARHIFTIRVGNWSNMGADTNSWLQAFMDGEWVLAKIHAWDRAGNRTRPVCAGEADEMVGTATPTYWDNPELNRNGGTFNSGGSIFGSDEVSIADVGQYYPTDTAGVDDNQAGDGFCDHEAYRNRKEVKLNFVVDLSGPNAELYCPTGLVRNDSITNLTGSFPGISPAIRQDPGRDDTTYWNDRATREFYGQTVLLPADPRPDDPTLAVPHVAGGDLFRTEIFEWGRGSNTYVRERRNFWFVSDSFPVTVFRFYDKYGITHQNLLDSANINALVIPNSGANGLDVFGGDTGMPVHNAVHDWENHPYTQDASLFAPYTQPGRGPRGGAGINWRYFRLWLYVDHCDRSRDSMQVRSIKEFDPDFSFGVRADEYPDGTGGELVVDFHEQWNHLTQVNNPAWPARPWKLSSGDRVTFVITRLTDDQDYTPAWNLMDVAQTPVNTAIPSNFASTGALRYLSRPLIDWQYLRMPGGPDVFPHNYYQGYSENAACPAALICDPTDIPAGLCASLSMGTVNPAGFYGAASAGRAPGYPNQGTRTYHLSQVLAWDAITCIQTARVGSPNTAGIFVGDNHVTLEPLAPIGYDWYMADTMGRARVDLKGPRVERKSLYPTPQAITSDTLQAITVDLADAVTEGYSYGPGPRPPFPPNPMDWTAPDYDCAEWAMSEDATAMRLAGYPTPNIDDDSLPSDTLTQRELVAGIYSGRSKFAADGRELKRSLGMDAVGRADSIAINPHTPYINVKVQHCDGSYSPFYSNGYSTASGTIRYPHRWDPRAIPADGRDFLLDDQVVMLDTLDCKRINGYGVKLIWDPRKLFAAPYSVSREARLVQFRSGDKVYVTVHAWDNAWSPCEDTFDFFQDETGDPLGLRHNHAFPDSNNYDTIFTQYNPMNDWEPMFPDYPLPPNPQWPYWHFFVDYTRPEFVRHNFDSVNFCNDTIKVTLKDKNDGIDWRCTRDSNWVAGVGYADIRLEFRGARELGNSYNANADVVFVDGEGAINTVDRISVSSFPRDLRLAVNGGSRRDWAALRIGDPTGVAYLPTHDGVVGLDPLAFTGTRIHEIMAWHTSHNAVGTTVGVNDCDTINTLNPLLAPDQIDECRRLQFAWFRLDADPWVRSQAVLKIYDYTCGFFQDSDYVFVNVWAGDNPTTPWYPASAGDSVVKYHPWLTWQAQKSIADYEWYHQIPRTANGVSVSNNCYDGISIGAGNGGAPVLASYNHTNHFNFASGLQNVMTSGGIPRSWHYYTAYAANMDPRYWPIDGSSADADFNSGNTNLANYLWQDVVGVYGPGSVPGPYAGSRWYPTMQVDTFLQADYVNPNWAHVMGESTAYNRRLIPGVTVGSVDTINQFDGRPSSGWMAFRVAKKIVIDNVRWYNDSAFFHTVNIVSGMPTNYRDVVLNLYGDGQPGDAYNTNQWRLRGGWAFDQWYMGWGGDLRGTFRRNSSGQQFVADSISSYTYDATNAVWQLNNRENVPQNMWYGSWTTGPFGNPIYMGNYQVDPYLGSWVNKSMNYLKVEFSTCNDSIVLEYPDSLYFGDYRAPYFELMRKRGAGAPSDGNTDTLFSEFFDAYGVGNNIRYYTDRAGWGYISPGVINPNQDPDRSLAGCLDIGRFVIGPLNNDHFYGCMDGAYVPSAMVESCTSVDANPLTTGDSLWATMKIRIKRPKAFNHQINFRDSLLIWTELHTWKWRYIVDNDAPSLDACSATHDGLNISNETGFEEINCEQRNDSNHRLRIRLSGYKDFLTAGTYTCPASAGLALGVGTDNNDTPDNHPTAPWTENTNFQINISGALLGGTTPDTNWIVTYTGAFPPPNTLTFPITYNQPFTFTPGGLSMSDRPLLVPFTDSLHYFIHETWDIAAGDTTIQGHPLSRERPFLHYDLGSTQQWSSDEDLGWIIDRCYDDQHFIVNTRTRRGIDTLNPIDSLIPLDTIYFGDSIYASAIIQDKLGNWRRVTSNWIMLDNILPEVKFVNYYWKDPADSFTSWTRLVPPDTMHFTVRIDPADRDTTTYFVIKFNDNMDITVMDPTRDMVVEFRPEGWHRMIPIYAVTDPNILGRYYPEFDVNHFRGGHGNPGDATPMVTENGWVSDNIWIGYSRIPYRIMDGIADLHIANGKDNAGNLMLPFETQFRIGTFPIPCPIILMPNSIPRTSGRHPLAPGDSCTTTFDRPDTLLATNFNWEIVEIGTLFGFPTNVSWEVIDTMDGSVLYSSGPRAITRASAPDTFITNFLWTTNGTPGPPNLAPPEAANTCGAGDVDSVWVIFCVDYPADLGRCCDSVFTIVDNRNPSTVLVEPNDTQRTYLTTDPTIPIRLSASDVGGNVTNVFIEAVNIQNAAEVITIYNGPATAGNGQVGNYTWVTPHTGLWGLRWRVTDWAGLTCCAWYDTIFVIANVLAVRGQTLDEAMWSSYDGTVAAPIDLYSPIGHATNVPDFPTWLFTPDAPTPGPFAELPNLRTFQVTTYNNTVGQIDRPGGSPLLPDFSTPVPLSSGTAREAGERENQSIDSIWFLVKNSAGVCAVRYEISDPTTGGNISGSNLRQDVLLTAPIAGLSAVNTSVTETPSLLGPLTDTYWAFNWLVDDQDNAYDGYVAVNARIYVQRLGAPACNAGNLTTTTDSTNNRNYIFLDTEDPRFDIAWTRASDGSAAHTLPVDLGTVGGVEVDTTVEVVALNADHYFGHITLDQTLMEGTISTVNSIDARLRTWEYVGVLVDGQPHIGGTLSDVNDHVASRAYSDYLGGPGMPPHTIGTETWTGIRAVAGNRFSDQEYDYELNISHVDNTQGLGFAEVKTRDAAGNAVDYLEGLSTNRDGTFFWIDVDAPTVNCANVTLTPNAITISAGGVTDNFLTDGTINQSGEYVWITVTQGATVALTEADHAHVQWDGSLPEVTFASSVSLLAGATAEVTVWDAAGNTMTSNCPVNVRQDCITYHFCPNYNLISLPLVVVDNTVNVLFPGIDSAKTYDSTGAYVSYDVMTTGGTGYLVLSGSDDSFTVCGQCIVQYVETLNVGYNLIGSLCGTMQVSSIISNPAGCIDYTQVYVFDCATGSWIPTTTIEPGQGALVLATSAGCEITAPGRRVVGTTKLDVPTPTWTGNLLVAQGHKATTITLGAADGASATYDMGLDKTYLPNMPNDDLRAFVTLGNGDLNHLTTDIRPTDATYSWTVATTGSGLSRVAWDWTSLPANLQAEMTYNGLTVNMRTTHEMQVTSADKFTVNVNRISLPTSYALDQNVPNPFNPATTISYAIPTTGHVKLTVYNVLGQPIRTLVDEKQDAGFRTITWDGTDYASKSVTSGAYLYRLEVGGYSATKRMVLSK